MKSLMTKALRKYIATRSRLENRYHKDKTGESLRDYRKQKNFCSRLYKKEKKKYYSSVDVKKTTDNKKFWKTTKQFFSNKGAGKTDITLIEVGKIIQEDSVVANIMNDFFGKAVASLNLEIPSMYITDESITIDNPIENIISRYSNHPSIKLINENVLKGSLTFTAVNLVDIEKEVKALDNNKSTLSGSIPPKIIKKIVIYVVNL